MVSVVAPVREGESCDLCLSLLPRTQETERTRLGLCSRLSHDRDKTEAGLKEPERRKPGLRVR